VIGISGYTHGDNAVRNPPMRTNTSATNKFPDVTAARTRQSVFAALGVGQGTHFGWSGAG